MQTPTKKQKPTKSKFSVLRQICNLIPNHLVAKLARETEVEDESRTVTIQLCKLNPERWMNAYSKWGCLCKRFNSLVSVRRNSDKSNGA
jgi:hypothetical protein